MTVVLACTIFVVTYAFIATERVHRVAAALGGVAAMALVGVADTRTAFPSPDSGIDWNVVFPLFGHRRRPQADRAVRLLAVWAAQRPTARSG